MRFKIVTPTQVFLNEEARKIVTHAPNGSFGLLPRHMDFVSELVPGVLVYEDAQGREHFVGINAGTLVKCGDEVKVCTRNAMRGTNLESLRTQVEEAFLHIDGQERVARAALARLEAGIVRQFIDLEKMT
ncbi:MAG TPA: F0F1 ATP synthase subunit epsilon [Alphaproteobacteria bacterium]|nr:F0F1 ATP synthase subunit epsilon [Alphaproteobacteria bacterium]